MPSKYSGFLKKDLYRWNSLFICLPLQNNFEIRQSLLCEYYIIIFDFLKKNLKMISFSNIYDIFSLNKMHYNYHKSKNSQKI